MQPLEDLRQELRSLRWKRSSHGMNMGMGGGMENDESGRDDVEDFLHEFEIAQLCNLQPDDAEDAGAWIPSLKDRLTEAQIKQALDIVERFFDQL